MEKKELDNKDLEVVNGGMWGAGDDTKYTCPLCHCDIYISQCEKKSTRSGCHTKNECQCTSCYGWFEY